MQTQKRVFSKMFKEVHGVKLSLISELADATEEADITKRVYEDVEAKWVDRYLDLQNEVNSLNSVRQVYVESIERLRDKMNLVRSQIESLGLDPREITEFENALLTDGIFNANIDDGIEVINVANNMTQL